MIIIFLHPGYEGCDMVWVLEGQGVESPKEAPPSHPVGGGRVPYVHTPHVLEMPSPMANTLNGSDSDSCSRVTWG